MKKMIAVVFCLALFRSDFAQDAHSLYNQGLAKANEGKFEQAIQLFDKALLLNPKYYMAWFDRGRVKNQLGRFKEGLADFNEAINLNPGYAEAWLNRGVSKYGTMEYDGALADFTYTIDQKKNQAKAYYLRGLTYTAMGKTDPACADFKRSLDLGFTLAKQSVDQCDGITKHAPVADNTVTNDSIHGEVKQMKKDADESNGEPTPGDIVTLDTTNGSVRLLAQGPMVRIDGRDTFYGIAFYVLPPGTGEFDSEIDVDEVLTPNPQATIEIELKGGTAIHSKVVLTGRNKSKKATLLFGGVFSMEDKNLLAENDLKKISIDSGKSRYEYIIKDAYAGQVKSLLQ